MDYYRCHSHLFGNYQRPYDVSSYNESPYPEGYTSYPSLDSIDHGPCSWDSTQFYNSYDPVFSQSLFPCSVPISSEADHFAYNPNYFGFIHEDSPFTRINIFYSQAAFNETDFEEYDPTPYSGGYSIAATYGEPLAPSEETCYPPTTHPNPLDGRTLNSVGPYDGKEESGGDDAKHKDGSGMAIVGKDDRQGDKIVRHDQDFESKPSDVKNDEESKGKPSEEVAPRDQVSEVENKEKMKNVPAGEPDSKSKSRNGDESSPEAVNESEIPPSFVEDGSGYGGVPGEKTVLTQIPSGYGLEAMDLCESVFGCYWPCLSRAKRLHDAQKQPSASDQYWTDNDPWKETSDYLFGDVNPYIS